jgi:surfactin synthase thioesterase subunit
MAALLGAATLDDLVTQLMGRLPGGEPTGDEEGARGTALMPFPPPDRSAPILYCLPPSGAGASIFLPWRSALDTVDINPVQYAGHETRIAEPPGRDLLALAYEVVDHLQVPAGRPYALLGHSLGALVAYEAVREIHRRGWTAPHLLVVSASQSPDLPPPVVRPPSSDDNWFLDHLRTLGGTPDEVLATPDLMSLVLPLLEADLAMLAGYRHRPGPPVDVPILALVGQDDPLVPADHVTRWAQLTRAAFDLRIVSGGHFAFRDDDEYLTVLRRRLAELWSAAQVAQPPLTTASTPEDRS